MLDTQFIKYATQYNLIVITTDSDTDRARRYTNFRRKSNATCMTKRPVDERKGRTYMMCDSAVSDDTASLLLLRLSAKT